MDSGWNRTDPEEFYGVDSASQDEVRNIVQYICLGIIKTAWAVVECLHSFYRECVDKFMRLGNNECHACRIHCASSRSLRDVLHSNTLVNSVYADVEKYEQEELVLYEDVKAANEQKLDLYEEEKAANVQYPICLGIIKKAWTVMGCLHRFYRECIDKFFRLRNNECHACRTRYASRFSLRDVLADTLVNSDVEKYEQDVDSSPTLSLDGFGLYVSDTNHLNIFQKHSNILKYQKELVLNDKEKAANEQELVLDGIVKAYGQVLTSPVLARPLKNQKLHHIVGKGINLSRRKLMSPMPSPCLFFSSFSSSTSEIYFPETRQVRRLNIDLREYRIIGHSMHTRAPWLATISYTGRKICLYNGMEKVGLPLLPHEPNHEITSVASFVGNPRTGCHVLYTEFYANRIVSMVYDPNLDCWTHMRQWNCASQPLATITHTNGFSWLDGSTGSLISIKRFWLDTPPVRPAVQYLGLEAVDPLAASLVLDDDENLTALVIWTEGEGLRVYRLPSEPVYLEGIIPAYTQILPFEWIPGQIIVCTMTGPGVLTRLTSGENEEEEGRVHVGSYIQDDCVSVSVSGGVVERLKECYAPLVVDGEIVCFCKTCVLMMDPDALGLGDDLPFPDALIDEDDEVPFINLSV